jgi:soluble lytic murein transglycosylase-like protein
MCSRQNKFPARRRTPRQTGVFIINVFVVVYFITARPLRIEFAEESLYQVRARYGLHKTASPNLPPERKVPAKYRADFETASRDAGIPPSVLESIAHAESKFNAYSLSPPREDGTQDLGMFQLHSRYLDWFSQQYNEGKPFDPMNPKEAVHIAARHIKSLYNKLGVWPDVVIAYNAGSSVLATGRIPDSAWDYLMRVYN